MSLAPYSNELSNNQNGLTDFRFQEIFHQIEYLKKDICKKIVVWKEMFYSVHGVYLF